jgi:eukaryotic-like serine/threonine-protein kinase
MRRWCPQMNCEACGHPNMDEARFCAKCGALQPIHEAGPDPMIGQLIGGRYRITGVLGEGGMGMVYVAEQQMGSTVRKVAVKTLHQHLSKDPSVLARFHRECGTVAQLEHPNTIKFYDFGATQDGTLYIAMEFVKGEPLAKVIETRGAMSSDRTLKILRQICGALEEAHGQGVIHRDLKPENVILTERAGETDFVKVLDFGIAARTESADAQREQKLTQQGMVLGTPPYMSPEQFTGKALDARSDIYSLGVMAYEMLTGKLPFEADTPWQWATQHMTVAPAAFEKTAPTQAIPDGMRRAIMTALAKSRDERQATIREFFTELSGGGRMTVEAPPLSLPHAVGGGATGTAEMAAAPNFGELAPPPSPPQAPHFAAPAPTAGMGPMGNPPGVAAALPAPPPVRADGGGSGKGMILALLGVGGVLLVAIAIVVVRMMKPPPEVPITLTAPTTSASGPATIAPQVDTTPIPTGAPIPSASASAAPETPVKPTTPTNPTGKPTSTAPDPAACDACIAAARGGNIQGAAAKYRQCNDPAKKGACTSAAKVAAPTAARNAAFNGDCRKAKAIAGAASAMGAGTPALNGAVATCK